MTTFKHQDWGWKEAFFLIIYTYIKIYIYNKTYASFAF